MKLGCFQFTCRSEQSGNFAFFRILKSFVQVFYITCIFKTQIEITYGKKVRIPVAVTNNQSALIFAYVYSHFLKQTDDYLRYF